MSATYRLSQVAETVSQMKPTVRSDRFIGEGALPISIWDTEPTDIGEDRSAAHLTGAFLHSRLFMETLVDPFTNDSGLSKNPDQFIQMCSDQQQGRPNQLKIVDEFQREYKSQEAVKWYTRETFIYKLLNRALRVDDIRTLLVCRFLIRDIHEQLLELSESTKVDEDTTCYRGQLMSKDEVDVLRRSVGSIVSMKSFLSTTLDEDIALVLVDYSDADSSDENIERVLFEITFKQYSMNFSFREPFANISEKSDIPDEAEVLFSIGSLFRISDIRNEKGKFWRIQLEYMPLSKSPLQTDDGNQLNSIYKHMKEREAGTDLDMGQALHLAGKFNQAESYYRQMIDYLSQLDPQVLQQRDEQNELYKTLSQLLGVPMEKTNYIKRIETQLTYYRFQLALVTRDKGDDDACLFWCEYLRNLRPDPECPATRIYLCYYHLLKGEMYGHSGQLKKAFDQYQKATSVLLAMSKGNGDAVASPEILTGVANVSMNISQGPNEPLPLYESALKICQMSLPLGHPRIGFARLKIADYYRNRSEFKLALTKYEECRQIFVRSLPPDHVYLGFTYYGMGICYKLTGSQKNREQMTSLLQQAATIFKKHLVPNHRNLLRTEQLLRRLKEKARPSSLPRSLNQWNENDVNRFLTERQLNCLLTLYGKMNGRALHNFYRICIGNERMLQEINADLVTIDLNAPKDQLTVDRYNRLLNELKIYIPVAVEPHSTMPASAICVVA